MPRTWRYKGKLWIRPILTLHDLSILYHRHYICICILWIWRKIQIADNGKQIIRNNNNNNKIANRLTHICVLFFKTCTPSTKRRNQISMMTSSNWNIFRVTGPLFGEFTGHRWIPSQRPVTRSFDVCFDLCLNKRLSKQSWGWWFETP